MKVAELNTALTARNISRNGLKEALGARLKEAVSKGMEIEENSDTNILSNMAGGNFEPMEHWELLATDKDDLVQYVLNDVDGCQLRVTIVKVQ